MDKDQDRCQECLRALEAKWILRTKRNPVSRIQTYGAGIGAWE